MAQLNQTSQTCQRKNCRTKYHSTPVKLPNGIRFDSKKEYERWENLLLLEQSGHIHDLRRQVIFELVKKTDKTRAITYKADFTYYDKLGHFIVEDVKGYKTDVYRMKKTMLYATHGLWITET